MSERARLSVPPSLPTATGNPPYPTVPDYPLWPALLDFHWEAIRTQTGLEPDNALLHSNPKWKAARYNPTVLQPFVAGQAGLPPAAGRVSVPGSPVRAGAAPPGASPYSYT